MNAKKMLVVLLMATFIGAAVQAAWVQGVTATTNSALGGGNGADQLTPEGSMVGNQTWANYYATGMWLSTGVYEQEQTVQGYVAPYVTFAFAAPTKLNEMWVWNGAQILVPGRALKYVDISYSTDGGATYTTLYSNYLFHPVPGLAAMSDWTLFDQTDIVDMQGITATNVRINSKKFVDGGLYEVDNTPENPWNPQFYYGLTQVHFTEVPEPASMLLLGLGSFALLKRKR